MCIKSGFRFVRLFGRLGVPRQRNFSTKARKECVILGIETSCDDTGVAIVNANGNILGEALHSQQLVHLNLGGIIPPVAQDLHRKYMDSVANEALLNANMTVNDVDAIAVTVKPGLKLSLVIGMKYAKYLSMKFNKPVIPIHHMEAHALMARMEHDIPFPFLTLLISGGHCLLALVQDVDKFLLLGESMDDAPGEAFDKTARRMKLRNIKEYSQISGGQAVELAALKATNPDKYPFPPILAYYRNCDFSFSGFKSTVYNYLLQEESKLGMRPDEVIPDVYDLCFSLQYHVTKHLCQRTQRAFEYIELCDLLPGNSKTLVISGGVACNNFIPKGLKLVCDEFGYDLVKPRPKLCTDNGIMIAWNGVEKWRKGIGITSNLEEIDIEGIAPLGTDIRKDVEDKQVKCQWVKLKSLYPDKIKTHL